MSASTEAALRLASAGTPNHLRRNFLLGVISGVAYNVYIVVLSTELVMTWFVSELTASNLVISLLRYAGYTNLAQARRESEADLTLALGALLAS